MTNRESAKERSERFSKIWASSRADAGKTQNYMAQGLGVSVKTIQNWESGVTSPDLFTGSEWFRILGENPLPYYLSYLFPNLFEDIDSEDDDTVVDQALMQLIQNATSTEKRELLYLMAGGHGSPWYSLLQMFTAHCHTSMKSRVNVARAVLDTYEMEEAMGELICPEDVKPDIKMLRGAIEEGKKAVISGNNGYTNVVPKVIGKIK